MYIKYIQGLCQSRLSTADYVLFLVASAPTPVGEGKFPRGGSCIESGWEHMRVHSFPDPALLSLLISRQHTTASLANRLIN
jgi:hypothetical protein